MSFFFIIPSFKLIQIFSIKHLEQECVTAIEDLSLNVEGDLTNLSFKVLNFSLLFFLAWAGVQTGVDRFISTDLEVKSRDVI